MRSGDRRGLQNRLRGGVPVLGGFDSHVAPPTIWPRRLFSNVNPAAVMLTIHFAVGVLLIGILQVTGTLQELQTLLAPLTVGWPELPPQASTAFVMGFVRRDFGAAGLFELGLSGTQILVALVTITLFVPCIASVLVITKERGKAFTAFTWFGSVVPAFLVGGIVAKLSGVL